MALHFFKLKLFFRPTSVFCSSEYCRFENLCLNINTHEYIFILDSQRSVFYPPKLQTEPEIEFGRLSPVVDHNLYVLKRLVTVPYSMLDKLPTQNIFLVPGKTLVTSRFKPDNWMHLLHDDLLPLYATIRQLGVTFEHLFLDDRWSEHHHNLSEILLKALYQKTLSLPQTSFPSDALVCFESASIGLTNSTLWYQYGFKRPESQLEISDAEKIYIANTITSFRNSLLEAFQLSEETENCLQVPTTLLVARQQNRRIINQKELFRHLQAQKGADNLRLLMLDKRRSLSDVAKVRHLLGAFACANTVVGMHGSELVLSMLMMAPRDNKNDSPTLVELFPYGVKPDHYTPFRTLADLLNYRYYSWSNHRRENAFFLEHEDFWPSVGLSHLSSEERQQLHSQIDEPLEAHLCCDNPKWLYRAYQDTKVDLDSFQEVLDLIEKESDQTKSSTADLFHLSDVTNLQCFWSTDDFHLTWNAPWNLNFISPTDFSLKYKVLIQQVHSSEGLVVVTSTNTLSLPSKDLCPPSTGCHIWVKPQTDHTEYRIIGSFSQSPLICTSKSML